MTLNELTFKNMENANLLILNGNTNVSLEEVLVSSQIAALVVRKDNVDSVLHVNSHSEDMIYNLTAALISLIPYETTYIVKDFVNGFLILENPTEDLSKSPLASLFK